MMYVRYPLSLLPAIHIISDGPSIRKVRSWRLMSPRQTETVSWPAKPSPSTVAWPPS